MGLLDELCHRARRLSVFIKLDAVIDALKLLVNWKGQVNWLVHLLIVGFDI